MLTRLQCFLMLILLCCGSGHQTAHASDLAEASYRVMLQQLLIEAGVVQLIREVPNLIDQELENLKATPLPFTHRELIQIRYELERRLAVQDIKNTIRTQLQTQFDETQLRKVMDLLQRPEVKRFRQLQADMTHESMRQALRAYKAKVKEKAPRGQRVDMLNVLADMVQYGALEADLKVELRKNLLMSVSWIKSNELIPEATLEKELIGYRQRVARQIKEDTLLHLLFMFRRTPTDQLQKLIETYSEPEMKRFLALCHQGIKQAFVNARLQAADEMKLALQR